MPPISYGVMTSAEIETTACATAAALSACNLTGGLFGSAACMLYGTTRPPNDIDVVVLGSGLEQEEIKRRLARADPAFFLVSSTNPRNTYKILWYNLLGAGHRRSRACKVDILIPGLLNIPAVSPSNLLFASLNDVKVYVLPFVPMLFLKLQGWTDHLTATAKRPDMFAKRHMDVQDIRELLQIVLSRRELLDGAQALNLPAAFVAAGRLRIQQFCRLFPDTKAQWDTIQLPQIT